MLQYYLLRSLYYRAILISEDVKTQVIANSQYHPARTQHPSSSLLSLLNFDNSDTLSSPDLRANLQSW